MFGIEKVGSLGDYSFVIIVTKNYKGEYLYSKKRGNDSWELQGGHIEIKETPYKAAVRELQEEAGIFCPILIPIADYYTDERDTHSLNYSVQQTRKGMIFLAKIEGDIVPSRLLMEMDEVKWFDNMPEKLTYPEMTMSVLRLCERF